MRVQGISQDIVFIFGQNEFKKSMGELASSNPSHQEGVPTVGPLAICPAISERDNTLPAIGDRSRSGNEPINHVRTELLTQELKRLM